MGVQYIAAQPLPKNQHNKGILTGFTWGFYWTVSSSTLNFLQFFPISVAAKVTFLAQRRDAVQNGQPVKKTIKVNLSP